MSGVTVVALSVFTGAVLVNDSFGYYTSWSDAYADTFGKGSPAQPAVTVDTRRTGVLATPNGRLIDVDLPGHASHINRRGYVYLPPQYGLARYHTVRFPVVELLHGTPGGPWNWRDQLTIAATIDQLMTHRNIGPMVFVIPQISQGPAQECLNYGNVHDETYVADDVPADIRKHFRVSRTGAEWALMGYSSGGYCAANIALHHRRSFGAVVSMDGYYWPSDGPAHKRLAGDPAGLQANNPLANVERLPDGSVPLPQFWISAGSGSADDLHAGRTFVGALQRLEHIDFVIQPRAGHDFYAWRDQVPGALKWLWTAIAPPALRVEFPTGGAVTKSTVAADPRAVRHPKPHHSSGAVRPAPSTTRREGAIRVSKRPAKRSPGATKPVNGPSRKPA